MDKFAALADPTRFQIFEFIAQGEKNVGEIASQFTFTLPAISQHLRRLRQAHLVRMRAEGQMRYYAVDKEGLGEIEEWLAGMKRHWDDRLDALELVLKEEQQERRGLRE